MAKSTPYAFAKSARYALRATTVLFWLLDRASQVFTTVSKCLQVSALRAGDRHAHRRRRGAHLPRAGAGEVRGGRALAGLHGAGRISEPALKEVRIFDGSDTDHADDTAFVLQF